MRGRSRLAFAAALCLALAGCGGAAKPQPLPRPTASLSPSQSASPTPPAMPAAAKEMTKAGALGFATVFIEAVNYAGATGDTQPLRDMYIPFCTRCESLADSIDQTYADGGYYKGGSWLPTRLKFYAIKSDVAFVDAFVTYQEQTWVPKKGATPKRFRESKNNLKALNLRWTTNGWRTSALDPNK
jgi:hypothetical protein